MNIKNISRVTQILVYRARLNNVGINETSTSFSENAKYKDVGIPQHLHNRLKTSTLKSDAWKAHSSNQCNLFKEETFWRDQYNNGGKQNQRTAIFGTGGLAFMFNLFKSSDDEDDENDPEKKLITTIKRSILCIQREQYDKAEQMLHLALRMAQDIQSKDGITYVYDLMANLAMEREQFKKAEKIFTDVMKRLFAEGYTEESTKILHISSKIAHMSQLQGELEKAHQGFIWTLSKLKKLLEKLPEDKDVQELLGLTKNWFGQLLMKEGNYTEAQKTFQEAFDCLVDIYGAVNDVAVTILNNISVAYVNLENYAEAKNTLLRAMDIVKDLSDPSQEGVLQANLGLIYLHEGLLKQAQDSCKLAYKIGKQHNNADAIEQAEYCLDEIKSSLKEFKRKQ